jgi:hypothetical protein
MNIAWRVMRRDRPQMLSCMNLRITGGWGNVPRAIEDQQLLLDENGFGYHGPGTTGAGEPGDRRQVGRCPTTR